MPIYRTKKTGVTPFVRIDKRVMEDERLSWKARGLMGYMLCKPDNFKFHIDELAKHATDGVDSARAGLKELEKLGYVRRYPVKEKGKVIEWVLDIYEFPKPDVENPDVAKPHVENPMLITNDLITNDSSNYKDKRYIDLSIDDHIFLEIYNNHFIKTKNKPHMQVSEEHHEFIMNQIYHLESYDVTEEAWEEAVKEHFAKLPQGNDGNIVPFLYASYRNFEVQLHNAFD